MNLQAKQLHYLLIALVVLLCASFFGIAYETNQLLGGQATKLGRLKADSQVVSTLEATLTKNKQDIIKYGDLNNIAETIVPQDKDQAEAVREIVKLATQSGISKLSSITFPSSSLGTITHGAAGANPNLTQLTPVPGVAGVYGLQITITQDANDTVPYDRFTTFLSKLEQNRRTAQVSSISIQPDASQPNNVAFTLVINEFIKP
ncbi:MAG TPA: hypothetical protein VLF69_04765 [Candidatus Saccharimonadales bacterium]|nr:hypothetical protein [Candidatus Saccharimonadales bacterium]